MLWKTGPDAGDEEPTMHGMYGDARSKLSAAHVYRPDALDANRSGALTPEQVRGIGLSGGFQVVLGLALGAVPVVVDMADLAERRVVSVEGSIRKYTSRSTSTSTSKSDLGGIGPPRPRRPLPPSITASGS